MALNVFNRVDQRSIHQQTALFIKSDQNNVRLNLGRYDQYIQNSSTVKVSNTTNLYSSNVSTLEGSTWSDSEDEELSENEISSLLSAPTFDELYSSQTGNKQSDALTLNHSMINFEDDELSDDDTSKMTPRAIQSLLSANEFKPDTNSKQSSISLAPLNVHCNEFVPGAVTNILFKKQLSVIIECDDESLEEMV